MERAKAGQVRRHRQSMAESPLGPVQKQAAPAKPAVACRNLKDGKKLF